MPAQPITAARVSEREVRERIASSNKGMIQSVQADYGTLLSKVHQAYELRHKSKMPAMRQAILAQSMEQAAQRFISSGKAPSKDYIKSAVANLWDVSNPITMLFSLLSIVVPNFAFMEACGVQPMPTKTSPIFYPSLQAMNSRNGVTATDQLLGATYWNKNNQYTAGRDKESISLSTGSTAFTFTPANSQLPVTPGTVTLTFIPASGTGGGSVTDVPGSTTGSFTATFLGATPPTVTYATGVTAGNLAANAASGDVLQIDYRYDLDSLSPAQVKFEWTSVPVTAYPRRIRSTYDLDNFYAAKKVLEGYNFDLDEALSTSMAGYINKEISNGIFEDMLEAGNQTGTNFIWVSTPPTNVSWVYNRLSVLQPITIAKNQVRLDTARSGGNVLVAGPTMINYLETLGNDLYEPVAFEREPIGPYVSGKLAKNIKVIKNQDYPTNSSIMTFKQDDIDAGYVVGIFIGLYATDPLALDTLNVVQGLGTQLGSVQPFAKSINTITISTTGTSSQ